MTLDCPGIPDPDGIFVFGKNQLWLGLKEFAKNRRFNAEQIVGVLKKAEVEGCAVFRHEAAGTL